MLIKNYKSVKTTEPQVVQIDGNTKEATRLTAIKRLSLASSMAQVKEKMENTFLPAGYPDSVTKEYLPFTIYSNASSVSITAMTFLSTQALFVALGG